jgi:Mrp family chromosome partitioning ATPase/capsular polysaccharide biosynthesis protein
MNPQDNEPTLSLEQALSILRRRLPLIALCFVLGAGLAFAYSEHQPKQYMATAALVFNNDQLSQQVAGLQASGSADPQMQQSTNVQLVELGGVASTAGLIRRGLTPKDIANSLSISAVGATNVVDVAATWSAAKIAAEIANTYSEQFVKEQQHANSRYFSSTLALVDKQLAALSPQQRLGPAGLALQDRAQSLEILAEMQSGNVALARSASIPSAPSSPKVTRDTLVGAVLGLLLGLGLAFLLERLDRRIKEPGDLERIFKLPLLGIVPESPAYPRHAFHHNGGERPAALAPGEIEVFRMLRARLRYFNIDRELRLVLVTSAASGDGKTTVVQNLAEAAASMGSRVLIVESDLRRPTLAGRLALRRAPGLAEVLISVSAIEEAVQTTSVQTTSVQATSVQTTAILPASNGSTASNSSPASDSAVSVLTAGAPPPNPAELIESHAMEHVLEWAAENYDLVLLDTPPLSVVPDAIPLLRRIDGVVIVSRLGKNTRDGAARMREELSSLGAPMLGVVANGFNARDAPGYSYDYYYEPAAGYEPGGDGAHETEPAEAQTLSS